MRGLTIAPRVLGIAAVSAACVLPASCAAPDAPPAPRERPARARQPSAEIEGVKPLASRDLPPPEHRRNPFSFGSSAAPGSRSAALPPLPPPDGLPELPLPVSRPAIRLLGITTGRENPPVRTAVLSVAGELVLAAPGEMVAGRYRVETVGEDAVDLVDAAAQEHLRLPLR